MQLTYAASGRREVVKRDGDLHHSHGDFGLPFLYGGDLAFFASEKACAQRDARTDTQAVLVRLCVLARGRPQLIRAPRAWWSLVWAAAVVTGLAITVTVVTGLAVTPAIVTRLAIAGTSPRISPTTSRLVTVGLGLALAV